MAKQLVAGVSGEHLSLDEKEYTFLRAIEAAASDNMEVEDLLREAVGLLRDLVAGQTAVIRLLENVTRAAPFSHARSSLRSTI